MFQSENAQKSDGFTTTTSILDRVSIGENVTPVTFCVNVLSRKTHVVATIDLGSFKNKETHMMIGKSSASPDLQPNRATRRATRAASHRMNRRTSAWRTGLVAAAATTALIGTVGAPMATAAPGASAAAAAARTASQQGDIIIGGVNLRDYGIDITKLTGENPDLSGIDVQKLLTLLDNSAVATIVASCRTGGLGTGGGGSGTDCSGSTGTGAAIVLPGRVDLAAVADQITINLGPDKWIVIATIPLGEQTPFGILSALSVKPTGLMAIGLGAIGLKDMDPTAIGRYKTLADVAAAAALPYKPVQERYCESGATIICWGGWKYRTVDGNLATRTEALRIAGQLSGRTYDYTKPTVLEFSPGPSGSSTILGSGYSFALSRYGGTAIAETRNKLALALAGADGAGATSQATASLGLALALNMNTSTLGLDWFGSPLNFDKIKNSKVLDLLAQFNMLPAGVDITSITSAMELAQNLKLPDLKEVSCLGGSTSASASGLGECSNTLGLFDYYKDLRAPTVGQSRQTSWGLTDPTSLFLGSGNLLSRGLTPGALQVLTALAGGDLSKVPPAELAALLQNPVAKEVLDALFSEEKRLKLTNDFVRFTQEVTTTETGSTTRYLLTSDYGLRAPITVDWLGYRLTVFPAAEVNGTMRPNYLGLPTITRIDGAAPSLLPSVGLIELANPFGLGTVPIMPFAPFTALDSWIKSVTIKDDVERIGTLIPLAQQALGGGKPAAEKPSAPEAPVVAAALAAPADDAQETVVTSGGASADPATAAGSGSTGTPAVEASETVAPDAPSTGSTASPETETSPEPAAEAPATAAAEATVEPEADTVDTDALETADAA